jgi:hypothetical protein
MDGQLKRTSGTKWFSICLRSTAAIGLCVAFLTAQSGGIITKDQKAKDAVDAALKALGGSDKIDGIKSLIIKGTGTLDITGRTAMAEAGTSTEYEFEIRMLLPDSFIQIVRYPESFVRISRYERTEYEGISQEKLLTPQRIIVPPGMNIPVPTQPPPAMERVLSLMTTANWSRFLIGMFVKAGSAPTTFSSRSTPGVFNMEGIASGEIEFDLKTGYPSFIKYSNIGIAGGENNEMRFGDRFSVNGIMFPRVIVETTGTSKKERRIAEVQINPKLSLKDFEVPQK